jgi:hypothetical protein
LRPFQRLNQILFLQILHIETIGTWLLFLFLQLRFDELDLQRCRFLILVIAFEPLFLLASYEAHQHLEIVFGEVFTLILCLEVHQLNESLLDGFVFLFIDEEKFDFHLYVLVRLPDLNLRHRLFPLVRHHPRFVALLHQKQQLLRLQLDIFLHISSLSLQISL